MSVCVNDTGPAQLWTCGGIVHSLFSFSFFFNLLVMFWRKSVSRKIKHFQELRPWFFSSAFELQCGCDSPRYQNIVEMQTEKERLGKRVHPVSPPLNHRAPPWSLYVYKKEQRDYFTNKTLELSFVLDIIVDSNFITDTEVTRWSCDLIDLDLIYSNKMYCLHLCELMCEDRNPTWPLSLYIYIYT